VKKVFVFFFIENGVSCRISDVMAQLGLEAMALAWLSRAQA